MLYISDVGAKNVTLDKISGSQLMHLYFAGLARNCGEQLPNNIESIIQLCQSISPMSYTLWIAENDSSDNTKTIISAAARNNPNIKVMFFDGLADRIPRREWRIAYCRDALLESVIQEWSHSGPALYIPIDLDSQIACSIDMNNFRGECIRVLSGDCDAVFPVSYPYYYDVFALRAPGWSEDNCWKHVIQASKAGKTAFLLNQIIHVCSRQISLKQLRSRTSIPVDSAFGGLGIYNIEAVLKSKYQLDILLDHDDISCEHVAFNQPIENKVISTSLLVRAPSEHILLRQMSKRQKLSLLLGAFKYDLKVMLKGFFRHLAG